MPQASIVVRAYNGGLTSANLLSAQQTIVLPNFGPTTSGTMVDNDGTLGSGDNGVATFNGNPVTFIGSGTVTPGVNVLGVTVPLGTSVPVVVFSAGGQIYFAFPAALPDLSGAVAMVLNINSTPGLLFTPVCFAKGTLIATPDGDRRIETLQSGDIVSSAAGSQHDILWIGSRTLSIPIGLDRVFEKWLPVRIAAHAFGPGWPYADLLVSQQHRIMLQHPKLDLLFGAAQMLAPARSLVGEGVQIDRSLREITYFHILCDKHVLLLANGLPAESLLLGPNVCDGLGEEALAEFAELFPGWSTLLTGPTRSALPVLRASEARFVRQAMDLQVQRRTEVA